LCGKPNFTAPRSYWQCPADSALLTVHRHPYSALSRTNARSGRLQGDAVSRCDRHGCAGHTATGWYQTVTAGGARVSAAVLIHGHGDRATQTKPCGYGARVDKKGIEGARGGHWNRGLIESHPVSADGCIAARVGREEEGTGGSRVQNDASEPYAGSGRPCRTGGTRSSCYAGAACRALRGHQTTESRTDAGCIIAVDVLQTHVRRSVVGNGVTNGVGGAGRPFFATRMKIRDLQNSF